MTSSDIKASKKNKCRHKCNFKQSKWSALNIFVMVFAFIIAWPIGLFILFWICSGRDVAELFSMAKSFWVKNFGAEEQFVEPAYTDNVVFNEYQQTQYDRVNEIKEEIKVRAKRFYDFRSDQKRREDAEEFNKFMSNGPVVDVE
ncbi:MAG: DUF2852 domain-containing protein [Acidiferrobacterales bacterium]|nr:DUF2852 domain-containing protein [Acidiferrobacterales bacterium]